MAQAFLIQKSGGGVNQTLPEQVTAFHAAANSTPAVVLTWTNPVEHFGGVLIVKKIGTAPTSPTDGEKIYSGTAETFTDADVQFDTEYFYRAFAYNEKKQYQTLYAVASAKPVAGIALSSLAAGALVNINEGGTAVPFYLAKHDYESGLNGAGRQLMVRKDGYDQRVWNSSYGADYSTSAIGSFLNGTYKTLLSEFVQNMISNTKFYYTAASSKKVTTLSRAVFLLSVTEYGYAVKQEENDDGDKYDVHNAEGVALPIGSSIRKGIINGVEIRFWTRTIRITSVTPSIAFASNREGSKMTDKEVGVYTKYSLYSRPCFTLPADALVYPTPNADGSYTLIEEAA